MAKRPPIQEFRSAIAKLKREGLLAKGIDARRAVPGRNLNAAIERFRSVLQGRAVSIPLAKVNLRESDIRGRPGLQLAKPTGAGKGSARVIITKFPGETVQVVTPKGTRRGTPKAGNIRFVSPEGERGISRIELPNVRTDTVDHFFGDIKRQLPPKRKSYRYAAQYMSGRTAVYSNLHELINTVHGYDYSVSAHTKAKTNEVIRNFALLEIPENETNEWDTARKRDQSILKARRQAKSKKKRTKTRRNTGHRN